MGGLNSLFPFLMVIRSSPPTPTPHPQKCFAGFLSCATSSQPEFQCPLEAGGFGESDLLQCVCVLCCVVSAQCGQTDGRVFFLLIRCSLSACSAASSLDHRGSEAEFGPECAHFRFIMAGSVAEPHGLY